jgi:hypothetical protein
MSIVDLLQTVGGRLGILETASKTPKGECPKIVTRTVSLDELKSAIRSEEIQSLADLPAELSVAFEKIFEAAGVKAAAVSWNIEKLKTLLQSEPFRSQDRTSAQKALLSLLDADRVGAEDLVKEAIAQDQALDAFEVFVRKKVEELIALAQHQTAEIEAKIQSLQVERARLRERIRVDEEKLQDWRKRKRAYERELAANIGYLTDRPVITTDEE